MILEVWLTIGVVFLVVWGSIIWEMYNTPTTSDDHSEIDEDIKN